MLETLLPVLLAKAGGRLLAAAVERRDLGSGDAAAIATAVLEAIVEGGQRTSAELARIEEKIDRLAAAPYPASVASGQRLLRDAAPAHRSPEDRRQLLADARNRFADAMGHAQDIRQRAAAEVLYGLTWLAAGSPVDAVVAFDEAAGLLEEEMLDSFSAVVTADVAFVVAQRRRELPSERLREAVFGPRRLDMSSVEKGGASDRWLLSRQDHTALQQVRRQVGTQDGSYPPVIERPHGSLYSVPDAALPVPVRDSTASTAFGLTVTMALRHGDVSPTMAASIVNRREEPVHVRLAAAADDGDAAAALRRSVHAMGSGSISDADVTIPPGAAIDLRASAGQGQPDGAGAVRVSIGLPQRPSGRVAFVRQRSLGDVRFGGSRGQLP